jgi:hypothetical protein
MQHAAIFEKKSVHFDKESLDHVRFYANERGSNRGNEGEEGHGKVLPSHQQCAPDNVDLGSWFTAESIVFALWVEVGRWYDYCWGTQLIVEGKNMFIAFPPTFAFPSGLPKTFLPTHHIFYSQRLFDMKDGLPKYARHKEEGAEQVDESEDADRSHGRGEQKDKNEPKKQSLEMDQEEAEKRSKKQGSKTEGKTDGDESERKKQKKK